MSLREAFEARTPRRARASLSRPGREGELAKLREQRGIVELMRATSNDGLAAAEDALARLEASTAEAEDNVEFQALPPAEFERMITAYTDPRNGEVREPEMRPHLFAACAVDESLRDRDWWDEQISSGRLSAGDVATMWRACWAVNAAQGDISGPLVG